MFRIIAVGCCCIALILGATHAPGETLQVGPGKKYEKPSQAINAASDGDTIEIDAGTYANDWVKIRRDNLTIRGVGGRAVLTSEGMIPNGKAIWVVQGDDFRAENIEFRGARVPDKNGAGIRQEGRNLTLRHCIFLDNENGILGGHGDCVVDIQHCEFGHNSLVARPGTHNLYIGRCAKLIFKYNYSHHAHVGHLLKSRAHENAIMYNRIADEKGGSSSYVVNLPEAGMAYIIGNILHQGEQCQNRAMIAYGEEGPRGDAHAFYFVNNTVINDRDNSQSEFLQIRGLPDGFKPVVRNNILAGKGVLTRWAPMETEGNLRGTVEEMKFVNREDWNLRLRPDSPCIDAGVAPGKAEDGFLLRPTREYVHPMTSEARGQDERIDVGAYEFQWNGLISPDRN